MSDLQTILNHAYNELLREWAEDDIETEMPLQVVLNALDDAKSDAETILKRVKDDYEPSEVEQGLIPIPAGYDEQ